MPGFSPMLDASGTFVDPAWDYGYGDLNMPFAEPMFAESYGFGEWDTLGYDGALDTAYPFSESYGYGEWGAPVAEPYLNLPDYTWMRD